MAQAAVLFVSDRLKPAFAALLVVMALQLLAASCTPDRSDPLLAGAMRVSLAR